MNYRHVFHAGNFADVFKHWVLTLLLRALRAKDAAFFYMDTHAGAGRYDLSSEQARKTEEYQGGIEKLIGIVPPPDFQDYIVTVRALNPSDRDEEFGTTALSMYPGSPLIAARLTRAQDRLVLLENAPDTYAALRLEFAEDKRVAVHQQDAYLGLKAFLPPREGRGLVLIDPAYEHDDDSERVLAALQMAHARWSNGIYAAWYPIKDRATCLKWRRDVIALGLRKTLCAEIAVFPEDNAFRLNGCGMILVNPPWRLDEAIAKSLPLMLDRLKRETPGRCEVTWLVPE